MSGFVYFIGCQNSGGEMRVKIGFTRRHPLDRLGDFQPGSPEELDVLAYIEGDLALERKLHQTFETVRLHNEWFLAVGCLGRLVRRLMNVGKGARAATPADAFKLAFFETVYDVVPDRAEADEWDDLETSADTSLWEDDYSEDYCRAHWVVRA